MSCCLATQAKAYIYYRIIRWWFKRQAPSPTEDVVAGCSFHWPMIATTPVTSHVKSASDRRMTAWAQCLTPSGASKRRACRRRLHHVFSNHRMKDAQRGQTGSIKEAQRGKQEAQRENRNRLHNRGTKGKNRMHKEAK